MPRQGAKVHVCAQSGRFGDDAGAQVDFPHVGGRETSVEVAPIGIPLHVRVERIYALLGSVVGREARHGHLGS
eukprot:7380075-Prymnesium_polylepis.1